MQLEELHVYRSQIGTEKGKEKDKHGPPLSHYTLFNAEGSQILEEALNVELIPTPWKVPTSRNVDMTK